MRMKLVAATCGVILFSVASSALAAAPEFGRCLPVTKGTGAFANSGCTSPGGAGKYEWSPGPGPNPGFTQTISGSKPVTFATVGGATMTCSGYNATGEVEDAERVLMGALVFSGCELPGRGATCESGLTEGVVEALGLQGKLGVISKGAEPSKDKIGLDLFHFDTGVTCGPFSLALEGEAIVPVKANKMQLTEKQKLTESKGRQKPLEFEGGPVHSLQFNFEQAGIALSLAQTNEEKLEVSSVL